MAKATKAPALRLTGFVMKTKTRDVDILEAKIDINNGRYIAKGVDEDGNKMTTILSKIKAEECLAAGLAEKGEGWEPAKPAKKK